MNKPKLSIVFTSYNHKEYLKQALDAILAQTFTQFELIIIDDCSTDGSQDVLKQYATLDSRIRLTLNKQNGGSYVYSTNQGVKLSTTPYVVMLQCDDYSESSQLEKLYQAAIENPNVKVIFSKSNMIDENGVSQGSDLKYRSKKFKQAILRSPIIPQMLFQKLLLESCVIPNLSAALIHRDIMEQVGCMSDKFLVLADWDMYLKISEHTGVYYINTELNNFRQHNTTIRSTVKIKRQLRELISMFANFCKYTKHKRYRIGAIISCSIVWCHYFRDSPLSWIKAYFPLIKFAAKKNIAIPITMIVITFVYPLIYLKQNILRR